jgi:peptidyl-tRNA hydrolase, PTH1 family
VKIVVGLGNPGDQYRNTRHNLGFAVLDHYAQKHQDKELSWENDKGSKSEVLKIGETWLVKPLTFMNNSGLSVSQIVNYYKINPEDLIVVYDELDLPLGKIKVRSGGSAAGHHGVESIIDKLGTDKFIRVRLGVGNLRSQSAERRKGQAFDANHFVLEGFMPGERSKVKHMVKQAIGALDTLLSEGLEKAQTQFN